MVESGAAARGTHPCGGGRGTHRSPAIDTCRSPAVATCCQCHGRDAGPRAQAGRGAGAGAGASCGPARRIALGIGTRAGGGGLRTGVGGTQAGVPAANLPEPLRSAVMRLQVGGVVHSQDRSQSFVMVGGQIAREGETLSPGITLERIEPRSLLLRVAGQAVELPL